ncbi:MAG: hypothetical protein AUG51_10340 [Acidobacteria bacterium 13_1_20CM_3_53_8]|nr:MAG: hypothetical protein AUG51_10340 [Acidobacteria bacterium 13_1_20CM_3_53_8]
MTTVAFIVNGSYESAMGHRARELAARLADDYRIEIKYRSRRRLGAIIKFLIFLLRTRPKVSYVFDMSYSGVIASYLFKAIFRNVLIVETGDAIYELAKSSGTRGATGLFLTRVLESFSLGVADKVVVRGSLHRDYLLRRKVQAEVLQDGVDTSLFAPRDVCRLREQSGLSEFVTVGVVGSSVWSEKLQMCYGWELVETLRLLKDKPVVGILIGDGSGIAHLKARCRKYGIEDKIKFMGYIPYEQLAEKLNLIDICLSTQTNNLVGQVRTTGKLPLYLAAGRYVLASDVGEAALVLNRDMLVSYDGVKDSGYPQKLAERIRRILDEPEVIRKSSKNVELAKKYFDYSVLAERMKRIIDSAMNSGGKGRKQ